MECKLTHYSRKKQHKTGHRTRILGKSKSLSFLCGQINHQPQEIKMRTYLVTGAAGFIGANYIKYLLKNEAKVVLCSHMGKPHNVFNETIKLNKKEKAKIEALPAEEQEAATAAAIEDLRKTYPDLIVIGVTGSVGKTTTKDMIAAVRKAIAERNAMYNRQIALVEKLEEAGEVTVIRPIQPITVDRMERNTQKLLDLYNEGYALAAEIDFHPAK